MVLSDCAGRLMVFQTELGDRKRILAPRVRPPFLDMPWDDAVALFRAKGIVPPDEFDAMTQEARTDAFSGARLVTENLRDRAKEALARSLETGGTFEDFSRAMLTDGVTLGAGPGDISYLDTVFRTNVLGAYGRGRLAAITDPVVLAARPFVQYRTANDARVREDHAQIEGAIFDASLGSWRKLAPPLGFNCRCSIVTLSSEDVGDTELSDPDSFEVEGFGD